MDPEKNHAIWKPFHDFFVGNNGIACKCQISHIQINENLVNTFFCFIRPLHKKKTFGIVSGIDIEFQ